MSEPEIKNTPQIKILMENVRAFSEGILIADALLTQGDSTELAREIKKEEIACKAEIGESCYRLMGLELKAYCYDTSKLSGYFSIVANEADKNSISGINFEIYTRELNEECSSYTEIANETLGTLFVIEDKLFEGTNLLYPEDNEAVLLVEGKLRSLLESYSTFWVTEKIKLKASQDTAEAINKMSFSK